MSSGKTGGKGGLDCYDFSFIGRPDKLADPYLWVDAADRGVVFDDSGDLVPSNWSEGTAPGYNFGLPSWSTDFSGTVRTLFDKSGHNHHLMNSLNEGGIIYDDTITPEFVYQANAAVIKTNDGSTKLYHYLGSGIYIENFDFSFVFNAPQENTARYGTLFASMCGTEDSLYNESWQICGGNSNLGTTLNTLLFRQKIDTVNYAEDIVLEVDAIGKDQRRVLRLKKEGDNLKIYLEDNLVFEGDGFDDMKIAGLTFFVNRAGSDGIPFIELHESVFYKLCLSDTDYAKLYQYYDCKWLHSGSQYGEVQNNPPQAFVDATSVKARSTDIIDVLSNDTDPDGDTLSVVSIDTSATTGTVKITAMVL